MHAVNVEPCVCIRHQHLLVADKEQLPDPLERGCLLALIPAIAIIATGEQQQQQGLDDQPTIIILIEGLAAIPTTRRADEDGD